MKHLRLFENFEEYKKSKKIDSQVSVINEDCMTIIEENKENSKNKINATYIPDSSNMRITPRGDLFKSIKINGMEQIPSIVSQNFNVEGSTDLLDVSEYTFNKDCFMTKDGDLYSYEITINDNNYKNDILSEVSLIGIGVMTDNNIYASYLPKNYDDCTIYEIKDNKIIINAKSFYKLLGPNGLTDISKLEIIPCKEIIRDKDNNVLQYKSYKSEISYEIGGMFDEVIVRIPTVDIRNTIYDVEFKCIDNITNIDDMFNNCNNLYTLDISNLDATNITSTNNAFNGCNNLTEIISYSENPCIFNNNSELPSGLNGNIKTLCSLVNTYKDKWVDNGIFKDWTVKNCVDSIPKK